MQDKIGQMAGEMWSYLVQNGEVSTARLIRELGAPRDTAQRAIGWLAREDKLAFKVVKGVESISLK
jgi:hypothetical protein